MYHSKEIRWFFKSENGSVAKWFEAKGSDLNRAVARVDYYHRPSLSESLGIKLREGRLELKQRIKEPYEGLLFSGTSGPLEEWMKWSFKLEEHDMEMKRILGGSGSDDWLKVQKARILVKIGLNSKGETQYHTASEVLERGCQVEYTKLRIRDESLFSFGLEWFGKPWLELEDPNLSGLIEGEFKFEDAQSYPILLLKHV